MDRLEKVERLRERANVSYEEAKEALEMAGDDLLDAMLILEKQGKVKQPDQSTFSTSYEDQKQYVKVQDKVEEQKKTAPGRNIGRLIRRGIRFVTHTSFHISYKGKTVFTMPSWISAIIVLCFWKIAVPAMLFALLLGVRYSFDGDDNTSAANEFLNKAGSFADGVQSELGKGNRERQAAASENTRGAAENTAKAAGAETAGRAAGNAVNAEAAGTAAGPAMTGAAGGPAMAGTAAGAAMSGAAAGATAGAVMTGAAAEGAVME